MEDSLPAADRHRLDDEVPTILVVNAALRWIGRTDIEVASEQRDVRHTLLVVPLMPRAFSACLAQGQVEQFIRDPLAAAPGRPLECAPNRSAPFQISHQPDDNRKGAELVEVDPMGGVAGARPSRSSRCH